MPFTPMGAESGRFLADSGAKRYGKRYWHKGWVMGVDARGYVYFVVSWDAGAVKIGFSQTHPEERFRGFRGGSPLPLFRWGFVRGDMAREKRFHRLLKEHRTIGEWFRIEGRVVTLTEKTFTDWHFAAPTPYELEVFRAMRDHPGELRKMARSTLGKGRVAPFAMAARWVAEHRQTGQLV